MSERQIAHRERRLDLQHEPRRLALGRARHQMILQELDVVDPLHERIADQVGMLGDEVEVAEVLGGQRRQIEFGRGKIDALAGLQPHPLLARGVNLDLGPARRLGDHSGRRLAVVDEHFGADGELVDEFGKIERESDRLLGLLAQFVDQNDPVAAQEARFRRRLHSEDAALRAGDVHQHPAGTLEPRGRRSHVSRSFAPRFRDRRGRN